MRFINVFIFCYACLLLSCAQVGAPVGGDVDKTPPAIVRMVPENETVNFSGNEVSITFDEYIELNDINNQLIISPQLKEKPEIELKRKTLKISFNEKLAPETTYSLNFGEGIKDFNAGNVLRNLTLAFSTGSRLDSLEIKGKVMQALSTLPSENTKVMLYDNLADSVPLTVKPTYLTQTDAEGNFRIRYLPQGEFKIFALSEEAGNFLYDNPLENIAFLPEPISLTESDTLGLDSIQLMLFNEEKDLGYITKVKTDSVCYLKLGFSANQKQVMAYQSVNGEKRSLLNYLNLKRDTLTVFYLDSSNVYLRRENIRFNEREIESDTIELEVFDTENLGLSRKLDLTLGSSNRINNKDSLSFSTNYPITEIDTSKVLLMRSDTVPVFNYSLNKSGDFKLNLMPKGSLNNGNYTLNYFPGAANYGGLTNDTTTFRFQVLPEKELSELTFIIPEIFKDPLLLLKNKKGVIVRRAYLEGAKITFNGLVPDSFELFLVNDTDRNKAWTTGDYDSKTLPEKVLKFPETIESRANWSLEYKWEL